MKLPVMLSLAAVCCVPAPAASLELHMRPVFDAAPLRLDSLRYALPGGETLSVTRLSLLLGGFALEKKEGGWVELPGQFAWLDAGARRLSVTVRNIPAGDYRAMRFAVGPDATTNGGDPAQYPADHPLNPNLNGLHWSWQGGYIFLALEGRYRTTGTDIAGYSYHFARDANRTLVTLPVELPLGADSAVGVGVDFDLAALLNAPRPLSPTRDGDSTHSRDGDPVAVALKANLPGAFQLHAVVRVSAAPAAAPVQPLYMPRHFTPYPLRVSGRFPVPALPRDNPLLVERVELGRSLFNDPLLSRDGTVSCAGCHEPAHAFSDTKRYSLGVAGRTGRRNAMPLFNLAWKNTFFWDGRAPSLRAQAVVPIQDHVEMDEDLPHLVAKLAAAPGYPEKFARAFDNAEITAEKIGLALENFLLTLTSHDSKLDRSMRGLAELDAEEKRGFELFFTEYDPRTRRYGADCFHCHGGALFSDHQFHNNGLGDTVDMGRYVVTHDEADRGKFSTPSLRNVALTAPYMHDGRFQTLEEVVGHYVSGVHRDATLDPNLAKHPAAGLPLAEADQRALVAFLKTLTDESLLRSDGAMENIAISTQTRRLGSD